MKNPHMLYRCPGNEVFEGVRCETLTVEAEDVESALSDGWHRDWMRAHAACEEETFLLADKEAELARIAAELASKGAPVLQAVHKGRGVYEVQDAEGNVIASGLTKDEAQARVAG